MASVFDRIYARSPVWLQHIAISAYGLAWKQRRYGGKFTDYVNHFSEHESFTPAQWQAYQTEQLRLLLLHAKQHVPYYTTLFARLGLKECDLQNFQLSDLSQLPILEKEQIRSQPELFVSRNINPKLLHTYHTSGTTGTPLAIKSTTDTDRRNQAIYEARVRQWAGVNYLMSRAMIGGRIVVPQAEAQPPFWRYNIVERQLYLSAFHIAPQNVHDYVQALNRFRPDYLVGYASSHYFLARMIGEMGIEVYQPKAILTSSEKLTTEMRATIEQVYRCPVFDGYSGVEACCLISECEHHHLHESPEMGIIELVDNMGQPVRTGEYGEIIATGLFNRDQPLIRYRTGDLTAASTEDCPCGRQMRVFSEIIGRLEDTVIGNDGREMVRFHGIFVGLSNVIEGQVIQETHTNFLLNLVVTSMFGDKDRAEIYRRFQERLGNVNLKFEYVAQIPKTQRGKFRAVISLVKRTQMAYSRNASLDKADIPNV